MDKILEETNKLAAKPLQHNIQQRVGERIEQRMKGSVTIATNMVKKWQEIVALMIIIKIGDTK